MPPSSLVRMGKDPGRTVQTILRKHASSTEVQLIAKCSCESLCPDPPGATVLFWAADAAGSGSGSLSLLWAVHLDMNRVASSYWVADCS